MKIDLLLKSRGQAAQKDNFYWATAIPDKAIKAVVSMFAIASAAFFLVACQQPIKDTTSAAKQDLPKGMFTNPLFANGADPWLEFYDGNYYLTTTTWTSQLVMRKSPTLDGLSTAAPVNIWSDTDPSRCCNFWAFEFHRLHGANGMRWYLMYTSGQHGTLDHQHLSVLESVGDDPMGPYVYKGSPMPDTWNIDGSYLEHNGQLYLLWSEWVGDEQLNWISKMTNPWTITGPRIILTRPEAEWEKSGRKVNEGPEILKHNGRTFLIYSASFCDTPDYKLAMKELTGNDPMNPDHWTKNSEPVFQRGNGVFGPGHNGFFTSPDGTEDWLVYHGNSSEQDGCSATRSVRAQKFTWHEDGTPNFGEPIPEGELLALPSGENGPLTTKVQGAHFQLVNADTNLCLATNSSNIVQGKCEGNTSYWVLDNTADGNYRLANVASGKFLGTGSNAATGDSLVQQAWVNTLWQKWQINSETDGWVVLANSQSGDVLGLDTCSAEGAVIYAAGDTACQKWRLQPVADIAITSVQSGRVLQAPSCTDQSIINVNQGAWTGSACQHWKFQHTNSGFYHFKTGGKCLTVKDGSVVPGANAVLGKCDSPSSEWRFELLADGSIKIVNRESGHNLDLANCGLAESTNIAQTQWFNTPCQQFHFRLIP